MVFNGEGCATIVLLYTYTESVERKKYVAQAWLDLNQHGGVCNDLLAYC